MQRCNQKLDCAKYVRLYSDEIGFLYDKMKRNEGECKL